MLSSAKARTQRVVKLLTTTSPIDAAEKKPTAAQLRILEALSPNEPVPIADLLASASVSISAVNTLARRGIIEIAEQNLRRDPLAKVTLPTLQEFELTDAQARVLGEIEQPLRSGDYAAFLLHGVTGSGKTEVYMRASASAWNWSCGNDARTRNRLNSSFLTTTAGLLRRPGRHFSLLAI